MRALPRRVLGFLRQAGGLFWAGVLVVLFAAFVLRAHGEVTRIFHVLRAARPVWLAAVLVTGIGLQALLAVTLSPILRRLGAPAPVLPLIRAQFQRLVVSTVVPLGGPASMVTFIRALNAQGIDTDDALYAMLLNSALGYVSFAIFIIPIIALLIAGGSASRLVEVATIALIGILFLLVAGLVAMLRGSRHLLWLERRLPRRVGSFIDSARAHGVRPLDLLPSLLLHLGVELTGVAMLYLALRAVRVEPKAETVFVGYAVGTLFYLVSPVFQGLGAVELSMTVALGEFGIIAGPALAAVLLYRAAELWVPLIFGISIQAGDNPDIRRISAHLPAIATAVTGLVTVLAAISRPFPRALNRLEAYSFVNPLEFSRSLAVVVGFLLLFLSWGLWRRQRVAWSATFVVLGLSALNHLSHPRDQVIGLVAGLDMLLLILQRRRFQVRGDIPTPRQGLARAGLAVGLALAYGTIGFALIDRREFGIEFSLPQALGQTLRLLLGLGAAALRPRTRFANWFQESLTLVGLLTLAYAAVALLRPIVWRRRTLPSQRAAARRLIAQFGDSSLDAFKTAPNMLYFFSSDARAVVAFGQARREAIAFGDPVSADPAAFQLVVTEFLDFCDAHGWSIAWHEVPGTHLAAYQSHGLSALKIGAEAVVELDRVSLDAPVSGELREAVRELEGEGYRAVYYPPLQAPELLAQLVELPGVEMGWGRDVPNGFRGGAEASWLSEAGVVTALDRDGGLVAWAAALAEGAGRVAIVAHVRRGAAAPDGIVDLLQLALIERLRTEGQTALSLGLVPFALVGADSGSPPLEHGLRLLSAHLGRAFAPRARSTSTARYNPRWEPRYFLYADEAALPELVLTLVRLTEGVTPVVEDAAADREPEAADPSTPAPSEEAPAGAGK